MKIGPFIRQLRLSLNLRQEDICRVAYIDQSKLSRIEKYDQVASFDEICRICDAMEIYPNELWEKVKDEYVRKKEALEEGDAEKQAEC